MALLREEDLFPEEIDPFLFGNPVPRRYIKRARKKVLRLGRRHSYDPNHFYPLSSVENEFVGDFLGIRNVVSGKHGQPIDPHGGILIGSLKMGYGHYRMSIAAASAAHSMGITPYWFDLLSLDGEGVQAIHDLERYYQIASRLAARFSWFRKLIWEPLTSSIYKPLHRNVLVYEFCRLFVNVYKDLPKEMPFVGSHAWIAQAALYSGFPNVVNMIYDNCPHGFHLSEGALHAVQTPGAYFGFRTFKDMGRGGKILNPMPLDQIKMTGHYVDHELVENVENDVERRMRRVGKGEARRFLISIGGAGAQSRTIETIVQFLFPFIKENKAFLMLNFGNYSEYWKKLCRVFPNIAEVAVVHQDWKETQDFFKKIYDSEASGIHVFLNENIFPAVYTTNLLMRATDFLITKPGELAFYPVPKIFIQRIGGHEVWSAIRGAELGDSTQEIQNMKELKEVLKLVIEEDDLLSLYCDNIVKLKNSGVYNGAYRVIEMAMERKAN